MRIGIFGTRRPSPYGKWVANEIARRVAKNGNSVIAMANDGIGGVALRASLGISECTTVGFTLADKGGYYPLITKPLQEELERNGNLMRIDKEMTPSKCIEVYEALTDYCDMAVIVEGRLKSGTALLAEMMISKGKTIFVVPGNLNQPGAELPNTLAKEGAMPITDFNNEFWLMEE